MADAIIYCDRCGRIITPSNRSTALISDQMSICAECSKSLPADELQALKTAMSPTQTKKRLTPRHGVKTSSVRRAASQGAEKGGGAGKTVAVVGIFSGVFVGVLVTLLLGGSAEKRSDARPRRRSSRDVGRPTPTHDPDPYSVDPERSAAQVRLAQIGAMRDPGLSRIPEMIEALARFRTTYADAPEIADADSLERLLRREYAGLAEAGLADAAGEAKRLGEAGRYEDARAEIELIRSRFDEGSWLRDGGEKRIDGALEDVTEMHARAVRPSIEKARSLLAEGALTEAREAVSGRAQWPEAERRNAEKVLALVDEKEREAERAAEGAAAWAAFIKELVSVGPKGRAAVASLVDGKREELAALGLDDELGRVERRLRGAEFVESLAVDGFKNVRGRVRVHWGDRPVTGTVMSSSAKTLKLKPVMGRPVAIPFDELAPGDVLKTAGMLAPGAGKELAAAAYLLLRGELDEARSIVGELTGAKAEALVREIDQYARMVAPEPEPEAEPEPAPEVAEEPKDAAPVRAEAASLVAHWTFDEGTGKQARDASGNGHDGMLKGGPKWVEGLIGSALEFDGRDDYVAIPAEKALILVGTSFTMAAWVKPARGVERWQGVFGSETGGAGLGLNGAGLDLRATVVNKADAPDADVSLKPGGWVHIAVARDLGAEPSDLVYYVNGRRVAERSYPDHEAQDECTRYIGLRTPFLDYFRGAIDDVRIYSAALDDKEIVLAMSKDAPSPFVPTRGLVAYWPLDEGAGQAARDVTGNGHHGEVVGATWERAGRVGGCIGFSGDGQHVAVPGSADFRFEAGRSWSISAHVKVLSRQSGWRGVVVFSRDAPPWHGLWGLNGKHYMGGTNLPGAAYTLGQWHHVVGIQDTETGEQRIYVDGELSGRGGLGDCDGKGSLWLGGAATTEEYLHGQIDEVCLYSRVLTADEIASLGMGAGSAGPLTRAGAGKAPPLPPPPAKPLGPEPPAGLKDVRAGLVGYWSFETSKGDKVPDMSGKGIWATLKGGARIAVGMSGDGLYLDGDVDFAEIQRSGVFDLNNKSFSISVWADDPDGSNIICRGRGILQGWSLDGGNWAFLETHRLAGQVSSKPPKGTAWTHLGITYDARAKQYVAYLNGRRVSTGVPEGDMGKITPSNEPNVLFGAKRDGVEPFYAGKIDEVRFYDRPLGEDEMAALYWLPVKAARDARIVPTAKRIAAVGGPVAASRSFNGVLKTTLTEADGYSFASTRGVASSRMTTEIARRAVGPRLARDKPEVVRVCFGTSELVMGRSVEEIGGDLRYIVEKCKQLGVYPVLYSLPVREPSKENAKKLLEQYNVMVGSIASDTEAGFVDAYAVLNVDGAAKAGNFSRSKLTAAGYERLGEKFLAVYRAFERQTPGRDARVPAGEAVDAGAAPADEPRATDEPVDEAAAGASILVNGGFEKKDDATGFAAGWRGHCWGDERARYSVRMDRQEAHDGDGSVVVRSFQEGGHPGIYTTLALPAGRYVLTYWAISDSDDGADVRTHVGGSDLATRRVKGEWVKLEETVVIKKRTSNASVKLWTTASSIRVWFDDVELRPIE